MILSYIHKFEKVIIHVMLIMLAVVILLATFDLIWIIGKDVITPPSFLLEIHELMEILGMFLLVLIGIELLHSVTAYITQQAFHLEIVLSVAMIAVARKIITLEPKEMPAGTLLGIAAIVLALAIAYALIRSSHPRKSNTDKDSTTPL
jgi:uncharacterized membrane protein (DUF373 family)